jgi:hypothetical protein
VEQTSGEPVELGSSGRPHAEGGSRRFWRQARPQPPDNPNADLVCSSCSVIEKVLRERKWRPEIRRSDTEPSKTVGHYADDLVRSAFDRHAAADHCPIASKQFAPARVTHDDHRPSTAPLVVFRQQRAPECCLDPEHLEEVPGDERASHETILDACHDFVHRDGIREDAGFAAHRVVIGSRERPTRFRIGPHRPLHRHRKQLTGIPYGVDTKHEDAVDREHRRDESKPKYHCRDDGEGGERCTTKRAERVEDVAYQVIDDTDEPVMLRPAADTGRHRGRPR